MIRLIQRRLIIPRGDTGSFTVPALITSGESKIAVFSIFNNEKRVWQKEVPVINDLVTVEFTHEDTRDFPIGSFYWDIKIYINPQYDEDGLLINGDEVHSYYAGFTLPQCDITLAPYQERG